MQWIVVRELQDAPWNLSKPQIYDLLLAGATFWVNPDLPLLPMPILRAMMKLEIWEEWVKSKEGRAWATSTSNLDMVMSRYGFTFNRFGWPQASNEGTIRLPWAEEPKPPTIEDAKLNIEELKNFLSEHLQNPWGDFEFGPIDDEWEECRILDARAKTAEIRRFLPSGHPLSTRIPLSVGEAIGSEEFREASVVKQPQSDADWDKVEIIKKACDYWKEDKNLSTTEVVKRILEDKHFMSELSDVYAPDSIRKWIYSSSPNYEPGRPGRKKLH